MKCWIGHHLRGKVVSNKPLLKEAYLICDGFFFWAGDEPDNRWAVVAGYLLKDIGITPPQKGEEAIQVEISDEDFAKLVGPELEPDMECRTCKGSGREPITKS